MKRFLLLLVCPLFFAASLFAQTYVSGSQSGSWYSSGNPYVITGDTWVEESESLTIYEDVVIEYQGEYDFLVDGILQCIGNPDAMVVITGNSEGSFTFDSSYVVEWNFVRIESGLSHISINDCEFSADYCSFESTSRAYLESNSATLSLNDCSIELDDADFLESHFIISTNDTITLQNNLFSSNSMGFLQSNGSQVTVSGCTVDYDKDDWYDTQAMIFINGGIPEIYENQFNVNVEISGSENTASFIRQDFVEEAYIHDNSFSGTIYSNTNADIGSLVGIFGGAGVILNNSFYFQVNALPGIEDADIDMYVIQYFTGEIDSSEFFLHMSEISNDVSTMSAISSCSGNFDHNLFEVTGNSWSYAVQSSDAEFINNTFIGLGDSTTAEKNISIASSTGILKNNIFCGIGTAISSAYAMERSYNCYWGYLDAYYVPPLLTGEINLDPQMSSDYHLTSISPCINTGDPTSPFDPDETRADMGAFYKDQSNRPQIIDYFPQVLTSVEEHTSQDFWISATDPAGTGLSYQWSYHDEIISTDSLADVFFSNAGMDSVKAWVYNSVGSDSQKWVFELTPVNLNLYVPQDFTTIQEAIDYSSYLGDTIRIAAGTYLENLVMDEKSVSMFGIYGAENTIIDGDNSGSVLQIIDSGSDTLFLAGLTFSGGSAESGGGLNATDATIVIDSCNFTNNAVVSEANGYGGGVYLKDCWARMMNVTISDNTLEAAEYARGGGLYCSGTFFLGNCDITGNSILPGATIGSGGGLQNYGGVGVVQNSVIRGNELNASDYAFGGGVKTSNVTFDHVEITENAVLSGTEAKGGGGYINITTLEHCTVSDNEAPEGGGLYVQLSGVTSVHNSIVALNTGDFQISAAQPDIVEIDYSNIFSLNPYLLGNCSPGQGCITADPMFLAGNPFDFHLMDSSPCIDTGDPQSPNDPDNTRADMGCYYFDGLAIRDPGASLLPDEFALKPPFPNPFNATVTLNFELPVDAHTSLKIYNSRGQLVARLLDRQMSSGYHTSRWEATSFSSGIYFLVMNSGEYQHTEKLLLLK